MTTQEQLKEYVVSEFMFDQNPESLTPDFDLLNNGVIDSMGILDLVSFMEENFGLQVGDDEITPENFRNLETLEKLIEAKNGVAQAA